MYIFLLGLKWGHKLETVSVYSVQPFEFIEKSKENRPKKFKRP